MLLTILGYAVCTALVAGVFGLLIYSNSRPLPEITFTDENGHTRTQLIGCARWTRPEDIQKVMDRAA